jgi:hypothetical protein
VSFLIRRNLPLAWAGWYDSFSEYPVGTIRKPWVHLGDGTPADFTTEGWLHIPQNFSHSNGGGESYEWMPFTPNWGFETELWFPVEGLAAQRFSMYFTDSWSTIGASFQDVVGISLSRAELGTGVATIQAAEFESMWSVGGSTAQWNSPVGQFYGQWITVRIWVENDEWIRIWLNDIYVGSKLVTPSFRFGPRRRCVRFLNAALCSCWLAWVDHYDRTPSIPPVTVWSSVQYDDFNRANGSTGGVWSQFGTDVGIASNSLSFTGASDGSSGVLWNTGNSSGKVRIEATVGGNNGPNATADSSLILCSNAAGTQALSANIYNGGLYISNLSGSLTSPTMSDLNTLPSGVTVAAGDKVAFAVHNGTSWLEINGVPKLYVGAPHGTVPANNTYAGLRVERTSGVNSTSWNDVRIFSGV